MGKKKLVITAISGNEEKWVEQWSKSVVKANPYKIIVNLTKYDDNTEELLRKFIPEDKLILVKFPWQKSFAEARNHYHDYIPEDTDYIFFVDMDEIITEESYADLELMLNATKMPAVLCLVNIYNAVNQENGLTASLFYPRLYPWRTETGKLLHPYFNGEVHNQLMFANNTQLEATRTNISLYHYGYALDKEAMAEKHKRSEELLRSQIASNPEDYFPHLNLAQLLRAKGDQSGTYKHAKIVIGLTEAEAGSDPKKLSAYIMALEQVATSCVALRKLDESIEASAKAMRYKPDYLDAIMDSAIAHMEKDDLEKAKFYFQRYLFVRSNYDERRDNTNFILNHLNSSFFANYHLGIIYARQGYLNEAKLFFKKTFDAEPTFRDVFIKYIHTLRLLGEHNVVNNLITDFMHNQHDKAYTVYTYFGDTALEDSNIELAKFNYYQALNMSVENTPEHKYLSNKWGTLRSLFGEVSTTLFDPTKADNELQKRM